MKFKDYYAILDIPQTATFEEIKTAYKKQALKWHPDRNPNIDTTEIMQEINEAYLILSDKEARKRYDIEYLKYKEQTFYEKENYEFNNENYEFNDEILKKWIKNAQKQAINLAKQTIEEISELSVDATKAAGKAMLNAFITYSIIGFLGLILFQLCSS